jgi:hypothetical protein
MLTPAFSFVATWSELRYRIVVLCYFQHRSLHSFENLQVAGAAAQISRDRLADLIARRARILVQQRFGRDQNGGSTVAALRRSEIGKCVLERMELAFFSEAFHRQDLFSPALKREHETGKHGLTFEKNGTSPAFTELTAVFRAGVAEIFPQNFEQRLIGRKGNIGLFAV